MTLEEKTEALLNSLVVEEWLYNPDALSPEEVKDFADAVGHSVYAFTNDDQSRTLESMHGLSEHDIIDALHKAGFTAIKGD